MSKVRGAALWLTTVGAVMVFGLMLRLHSLAAGLPAINDPDELTFQLGALKMLSDALNPGWFGHPALTTMYALAFVDVAVFLVGLATGQFDSIKGFGEAMYADPTIVMLPGRLVSVAASMGCIWLVLRLAKREWGQEAALVSAGLVAVSPVFVVWSQVIRSDIIACFFMMLALRTGQRILHDSPRRRDIVLAALWTAAAVASKWPFAVTALGVAVAIVLGSHKAGATKRTIKLRLVAYAGLSLAWLVAISPYLLLRFDEVLRNVVGESQKSHLGATGGSPLWNAWWYASGPIPAGLGWLGLGLALFGLFRFWRDRALGALVVPPLIGFITLLISQNIIWERWALPLIVLMALSAGMAAAGMMSSIHDPRRRSALLALTCVSVLVQPAWETILQNRMRNNDTRQQAAAWAKENFQPGSRVLVEHFGFDMLEQPWVFFFPLGKAGCVNVKDWLHGKADYARVQERRGSRTNVDYGTMNRSMEGSCRIDYAMLTQYDRYVAERYAYPEEVGNYERLISRGKVVAIFAPKPGESLGPTVMIVKLGNGSVSRRARDTHPN